MDVLAFKTALWVQKLTQRQLSLTAAIPEARLSAAVHGRVKLTADEKTRVAAAISQSVNVLFGRDIA